MILYNENGFYGLQIPYIYFFWEFFSNICKRGEGANCIVIWIICVTNLHFFHQFSRTRNLMIHLHKDIQFHFLLIKKVILKHWYFTRRIESGLYGENKGRQLLPLNIYKVVDRWYLTHEKSVYHFSIWIVLNI